MITLRTRWLRQFLLCFASSCLVSAQLAGQQSSPGVATDGQRSPSFEAAPLVSEPLLEERDLADRMLTGIDTFLLRQIDKTKAHRALIWQELTDIIRQSRVNSNSNRDEAEKDDRPSPSDQDRATRPSIPMEEWINLRRKDLVECLGLRDERLPAGEVEILRTTHHSGILGRGKLWASNESEQDASGSETHYWQAWAVRWHVLQGVSAEGLMIEPLGLPPKANMIAIPDADQTPEQIAGLVGGLPESQQTARILAAAGCRVLVPTLIDRQVAVRGPPGEPGRAELTSREFVYRPAYELGRHIIGYEVQKVLAAVDWLSKFATDSQENEVDAAKVPLGVVGYGEGGSIALLCGALDSRIDNTYVKGSFGPREKMWREPICRNLFGFLKYFSDAELAAMIWPRTLVVDFAAGPEVVIKTNGGAPGELTAYSFAESASEFRRAADIVGITMSPNGDSPTVATAAILCGPFHRGQAYWLDSAADSLTFNGTNQPSNLIQWQCVPSALSNLLSPKHILPPVLLVDPLPDARVRQSRQVEQLIQHTQTALAESSRLRQRLIQSFDTTSLETYQQSIEPHRKRFYEEIIGRFDEEMLPVRPKSRRSWQTERWTGHEVVLDVWPDVIAYGVLLLPNDLVAGEKRPVVVCQHGLEGRPTDVFLGDHPAYQNFAAKLCERGYIVFAPQNPYLMQDRFRTLQRKANSIGRSLFSIIIPQHRQILNWLKTLPHVDSDRIAFYGLSYGGKSAMRIPAVLTDYCLSICSADFNEWIIKNASTTDWFSYVWTGEYEIFEYNLGNTFGYAEMASLICPRPFMVERGHFDTVAVDQWVGYEYAKVLNLYQARLGIGSRTEIEWFPGPHTINGKGTFDFLDRHLQHGAR